ncbi:MAG: DDE transposase family protein [Cyanobacteria bacterium P01_A01_bin.37]
MMTSSDSHWYILQRETGQCDILSSAEIAQKAPSSTNSGTDSATELPQQWGPFSSEGEAIAKRVGLIRSGKCKPR